MILAPVTILPLYVLLHVVIRLVFLMLFSPSLTILLVLKHTLRYPIRVLAAKISLC